MPDSGKSGSGNPIPALSHDQLYEMASQLGIPNFHVVMHDELKGASLDPKVTTNIIVNLDRNPQGSGTHFVAIANLANKRECYYMDSYGVTPSDIIKKYMKTSGKKCVFNDGGSELQEFDSSACGMFCLNFLKKLNSGMPFRKIIYQFKQHPSDYNENLMEKFAEKNKLL